MPCNCGSKNDWSAILDTMPPNLPRLRVSGTADCTTTGYKNVRLEPKKPQGINPRILLLELTWDAPDGIVGQIITPHPVSYHRDDSPMYDEVVIVNCNDKKIKVEVVT